MLLLSALTLINLGLLLWVSEVMELSNDRAGPIEIKSGSIAVRGDAEFTQGILAKSFSGFDQQDLLLESNQNVRLRAATEDSAIASAITVSAGQVETATPNFRASFNDQAYFEANAERVAFHANEILVTSDSGLVVEGNIQAARISNTFTDNQGLTVESVGQGLDLTAATNLGVSSQTGNIDVAAFANLNHLADLHGG